MKYNTFVAYLFLSAGPRWSESIKGPTRAWVQDKVRLKLSSSVLKMAASMPASSRVNEETSLSLIDDDSQRGGSASLELPLGNVLSNAALVAGNMIGAGVLALPEVARAPGFVLSTAGMVVVWAYCLATGLLIAECSGDGRESIRKMAEVSLGRTAGNAMCAAFLAANYLLMVAYISQGGSLLSNLPFVSSDAYHPIMEYFSNGLSLAPLMFTALAGTVGLWGPSRWVNTTNSMLVGVIALTFVGLVRTGMPHVELASLGYTPDASALPAMLPVALCALAFQNVVPLVSKNLEGDSKGIRSSLIIGSGIPLSIYVLWNAVVLGNTSGMVNSVVDSATNGVEAVGPSSYINVLIDSSPSLGLMVSVFSMAAIITSFWGAASSLMMECTQLAEKMVDSRLGKDSTAATEDPSVATKNSNSASKDVVVKSAASALVLLPPAVVSVACPDSFLSALQYTGVFVDPFLYGLAPAVMAYRLRGEIGHTQQKEMLPGGTVALVALATLTAAYTLWQTSLLIG